MIIYEYFNERKKHLKKFQQHTQPKGTKHKHYEINKN